ncbi:hypothetical protein DSO57_1025365 [Entomophthora muscae]|nr:hypothetical protein DSO57_1025365 [Entomophthora muscae]
MKKAGRNAEEVLKTFSESISKYRFMESNMLQRKKALEAKIPEIKKSLDMVQYLSSRKDSTDPINVQYELNDTLFAKAKITPSTTVNLWLGANVMLEYTLSEAEELLQSKLNTATNSKSNAEEDMEFLRDQITTMEVNTARIYNWDVKMRRISKASKAVSAS